MITKVTIEWKNGDRRTFEEATVATPLTADKLRAARAVIGEDLPKKADEAKTAA